MCCQPSPSHAAADPVELSVEERRLLLQVAHRAIEGAFRGKPVETAAPTPRLAARRGAFTTLHLNGRLRGCVGYILPACSLYRTVAETAVAAAFNDARFLPVTEAEAARLKVEISVLSHLRPITPDEIEIGRHGLVVTLGLQRGLLLPQVPVEYGWDRITFLEQTCTKAGLAPHAWKHGAVVEAFTAEIFGEAGC